MSFTIPASVPVEGTRRVYFLPTAANINAITLAEVLAGVLVGCYITTAGWQPSSDQASIKDGRLCSSQDFEQPGKKTKQLALQYSYNLAEPDEDEARLTLVEGTTGILLNLLQKPEADPEPLAGDWYEAWPVKCGEQVVMPVEENAIDRIQQKQFVTGQVAQFKKLVAQAGN